MDQDAFRNLLASSQRSQPNARHEVPAAAITMPKKATIASSEPAFKPRKVKKAESKYRDRAAERREGAVNDYAQAEAVLEDFERRAADEDKDAIEQQRKYLGGDSQHTILVKGLDMSLLEQNRARAAASTEDDEILERVFIEATSTAAPTEPRKRTREEIIRNLKAKQQNGEMPADQPAVRKSIEEERSTLETAKMAGKFRPIGFKPTGQTEGKPKKRKVKREENAKKKQKREGALVQSGTKGNSAEEVLVILPECDTMTMQPSASSSKTPQRHVELEPAPLDDDLDIFAGAGEYEGFPVDESDEEHHSTEEAAVMSPSQKFISLVPAAGAKGWFNEPETESRRASVPLEKSPPAPDKTAIQEPEEMRLKPLESSALPSIRDFLAMDEAAGKVKKRKSRKEKKKAGDNDDD